MPVSVLSLNVIRQTPPVGASVFRLGIKFLRRAGQRCMDEIRRHCRDQSESGLIGNVQEQPQCEQGNHYPIEFLLFEQHSVSLVETLTHLRRYFAVRPGCGGLSSALSTLIRIARQGPPRSCNCDANGGKNRIRTDIGESDWPDLVARKRLEHPK